MDKREAIDILVGVIAYNDRVCNLCPASEKENEALDLAIEALGQTEIDDCDNFYKGYCSVYEDGCFHQCEKDCINRKQAIEALTGWQTEPLDDDIVRTLEALPPVPQKQVTSKLKNPDDSLLTDDSDECKEQKSKLEETPTTSKTESVEGVAESATTTDCISRADAIAYIDRILNSGLGKNKSLDYIRKYISALPPVNQKQVTGKLKTLDDSLLTDDSEACKEQKSKLESDLISRQAAIEAVANHFMTDALIRNPSASNDIEDWKKIAERVLSNLPPVTPKEQQEHGRLIDADYLLQETFTVDEEEWTTPEIRAILENAPPVEPKRPKGTETMIVDGMEIEIDPVSYEVGYTHGQFSERPKGEWIKATGVAPPEFAGRYVCSNCSSYALMNMPYGSRQKLSPFCPNCGADMRGDKE